MNIIANFKNPEGAKWVSWEHEGRTVSITGTGRVIAKPTGNGKVVAVEIDRKHGQDNAFIYSADGTSLGIIKNPIHEAICFDDIFFDGNELTLVAGNRDFRTAVVIDDDGNFIRDYQTI